ncbi:hypothetical protein ACFXJ8_38120 [Nonomuraea sp. NPDC059194]|uniref:hypothetical protein n=1 Tax=Nonomuraea sp. NPDC059194 TaxID=3346764 RepID=UPI0036B678E4
MIKKLHSMGLRSGHMYAAGFAAIGASICSWLVSASAEDAGIDRADRWGIFIGEWAPTFFALGLALRMEETHTDKEDIAETAMFDKSMAGSSRARAGV